MVFVEVIRASNEEDHGDGRHGEDGTGRAAAQGSSGTRWDVLREGVRVLAEAVMDLEVEQHLGASRHGADPDAAGSATGIGSGPDTRVGTIDLRVPRVRDGNYFPALLEPRTRAERALVAVVQEAYVGGVSTRRVDALVKALGLEGISKSQVSRLCAALDEEVERFRMRPLLAAYPYLWLDATFVKVRQAGRVVSQAVVLAVGVSTSGVRKFWAWTWARARMGASRCASCAGWWPAACAGCNW